MHRPWKLGTRNATLLVRRALIQNAVFCEESFGENRALYVHLAYKDDRFRKGSVQELYRLKGSQVSRSQARNVLVR